MPKNRRVDRPIILGIVGDSAAGKTTLTAGIANILGADRVVTICTDDYHRYSRTERVTNGLSALDPRGNYVDILEQHIRLLRDGQAILKPVYNHHGGTLDRPEYILPKEYVILEGLLGYTTRAMRDCYDVKVYLEPIEDLRMKWKIQRDTAKRGYTAEQVVWRRCAGANGTAPSSFDRSALSPISSSSSFRRPAMPRRPARISTSAIPCARPCRTLTCRRCSTWACATD